MWVLPKTCLITNTFTTMSIVFFFFLFSPLAALYQDNKAECAVCAIWESSGSTTLNYCFLKKKGSNSISLGDMIREFEHMTLQGP